MFQNYLSEPLFKTLISQYIVSGEAFSFNCPSHQVHKRKCLLKGGWYNPTPCVQNTIHNLLPWGLPRWPDFVRAMRQPHRVEKPQKRFTKGRGWPVQEVLLDILLTVICSHQSQLLCLSRFYWASTSAFFYLTPIQTCYEFLSKGCLYIMHTHHIHTLLLHILHLHSYISI